MSQNSTVVSLKYSRLSAVGTGFHQIRQNRVYLVSKSPVLATWPAAAGSRPTPGQDKSHPIYDDVHGPTKPFPDLANCPGPGLL